MNELELKPCPFCGGEASPDGRITYSGKPDAWWADGTPVETAYSCNCIRCGCNNRGIVGGYQTRESAIAAWNTRAIPAAATDQLVPPQTWQPIESAPKDGTPILTLTNGCDNSSAMVMWWTPEKAELCGYGWEAYEVDHMLSPDLWMPLPAAPAPEVAE